MLLKRNDGSCVRYLVDKYEMNVELWNNWKEWSLIKTVHFTPEEMVEFLYDAMKSMVVADLDEIITESALDKYKI